MRRAIYVACFGENTAVTKLIADIFSWLGTGSTLLMWRVLVWLCARYPVVYLGAGKERITKSV
jgi:hypothetical protein